MTKRNKPNPAPVPDSATARMLRSYGAMAKAMGPALEMARVMGPALEMARMTGPALENSKVVGASVDMAKLTGPRTDVATRMAPAIDVASLIGPSVDVAKLIGPSVDIAKLIGPSVDMAKLTGPSVDMAKLAGVTLDMAKLMRPTVDINAVLATLPREALDAAEASMSALISRTLRQSRFFDGLPRNTAARTASLMPPFDVTALVGRMTVAELFADQLDVNGLVDPLIPVADLLGTELDPTDLLGEEIDIDACVTQPTPVASFAPDLQEIVDAITTRLDELAAEVKAGFRGVGEFQSIRRQFTLILLASVLGAITSLLLTAAIVRLAPEMITIVDVGHDSAAQSANPGSGSAASKATAEGLGVPEEEREMQIGDVVVIEGRRFDVVSDKTGGLAFEPVITRTVADICEAHGGRPLTQTEFDELFGDLPSDGEG